MKKDMHRYQDSYLVSLVMNSFSNTITQIYITRPEQWKDIVLDYANCEYKHVTITEIIWQNGKAAILRIEINSAEHSSSIMNLLSWVSF